MLSAFNYNVSVAIFRNLTLQRLFCLIFLGATLLSHTQILFACKFMHGKPKLVCCCGEAKSDACPMTAGCAMQQNTKQGQCCDVSQDSLPDVAVTKAPSTAETLILLLDSPQPPPIISFQEFSVSPLLHLIPTASPPEPLLISSNTPIYLRTLRIRL
jgi:hypothetical protein